MQPNQTMGIEIKSFSKDELQMTNRHKTYSTSEDFNKMQRKLG